MSGIKRFITPPIIIGAAIVIALLAMGIVFFTNNKPSDQTVEVVHDPAVTSVEAVGSVTAAKSIDLGFQRGGTISSISVDVSDHVVQGQMLASLSNADLVAAREGAKANLDAAEARLADLKNGTRSETVAAARLTVAQAIIGGYVTSDDAVHNKAAQFITNLGTPQQVLTFPMSDQQLSIDLVSSGIALESTLNSWKGDLPTGDTSSETDLVAQSSTARGYLLAVGNFLDMTAEALSDAVSTSNVSATTLVNFKTNIGVARSSVSGALAALNTAAGALSVDEAGASTDSIAAAQAAVDAAQAALDGTNAALAQTVIRSPISGIITRQDGNVGEVAAAGQAFLSLDSDARFEVKASVSEADIAKVAVGQPVSVRVDAYPDVTFAATVTAIDPAATISNGTPSYTVTVQFKDVDQRLKAGLTANLSIAIQ